MIHLIRRLRDSAREVRASDWLLVAVEGLLVFIGIIAAFQLQEWAEDRREAKRTGALLERLFDETNTAAHQLDFRFQIGEEALDAAEGAAVDYAEGRCPAEVRSILRADYFQNFKVANEVLSEVIDVAGLSTIPDTETREAIRGYRFASEFARDQIDALAKEVELVGEPLAAYYRPRPSADRSLLDQEFEPFWLTRLNRSSFIEPGWDREGVCADPEVERDFYRVLQMLTASQDHRGNELAAAVRLCVMLGEKLGKTCLGPLPGDGHRMSDEQRERMLGFARQMIEQDRKRAAEIAETNE